MVAGRLTRSAYGRVGDEEMRRSQGVTQLYPLGTPGES